MDFMTKIENHLVFLDKDFQALNALVKNLNVDLLEKFRIFEIEKNKIRLKLGSRKNVAMNYEYEDYSV